jgi:hypothetical protein
VKPAEKRMRSSVAEPGYAASVAYVQVLQYDLIQYLPQRVVVDGTTLLGRPRRHPSGCRPGCSDSKAKRLAPAEVPVSELPNPD